ncbi:MAG TPA: hypothetical protein VGN47_13290 [Blastococcus sp.]|jgi:hypothetical protein|nr:hypothetical protein [Blastococcus sp.]
MVDDEGSAPATAPPRFASTGALVTAVVAVAAPVLGGYLYRQHTEVLPGGGIAGIELDGGALSPARVVALAPAVRAHLLWDLPLIALYGLGLVLGALLALSVSRSATGRRWARFGLFATAVTVLADLVEDGALWWAFRDGAPASSSARGFDVASVAAVVKFSASVPAAVVLVVGVGLTVGRVVAGWFSSAAPDLAPDEHRAALPVLPGDAGPPESTGVPPATPAAAERARWWRGYNVPACGHPHPGTHGQPTGICLSGGGIRAASVAMGALQSPEFRARVVPAAQYLVSVSGGGYTAGAFQQALTGAGAGAAVGEGEQVVTSPATAFLPGTAEEDHVRRHASYLASNLVEILVALALLARHLLLTLILLFGPAVLLGVAAGACYRFAPVTVLGPVASAAADGGAGAPAFPAPRAAAWWALGLLAALAVGAWLIGQLASAHGTSAAWAPVRRVAGAAARMLAGLTLMVAGVTLVVPTVVWLSGWLLHQTGGSVHVAGPVAGVLLAYGASIASVAWRHRKLVTDKSSGLTVAKAAPRGAVQLILVVVTLVVLSAGWLLLVGSMATVGLRPLTAATRVTLGVLAAVVVFLGGLSDETTLSLHPFYRARLASAFAVRRVRRADGQTVARAYAPEERTVLSEYGALAKTTAFPHVVFAASATVGEKRTAPGAHRVTYTFCSDWVGGPDLGYLATERMVALAPPRLQRDLTVQGAVALSGAAIAASIGGERTAWYETLLVVTGVRLGAWMPNPAYLIDTYTRPRPWHEPGLPRARRLSYLVRQLFGAHSVTAPLVQVTDGGFYDNLGLVELFRRGVTRIYCIDASGDSPPAATTLAQALTLAQQELGVHTDLEAGTWTTFTAGGADPLAPASPLARLSARLSQRGVITGTFRYPEGSPYAGRGQGVLVVAKASLWPALAYPVLAYAQDQGAFPRDSTGDQFFDDRQYAAYTALGRALGTAAVAAMDRYDAGGNLVPPPAVPAPVADGLPIPQQHGAGMA